MPPVSSIAADVAATSLGGVSELVQARTLAVVTITAAKPTRFERIQSPSSRNRPGGGVRITAPKHAKPRCARRWAVTREIAVNSVRWRVAGRAKAAWRPPNHSRTARDPGFRPPNHSRRAPKVVLRPITAEIGARTRFCARQTIRDAPLTPFCARQRPKRVPKLGFASVNGRNACPKSVLRPSTAEKRGRGGWRIGLSP